MEAAVDSGDGSPSTWQPASRIALSAENSSLLEVQFTGTLRASVLVQVVAGEFVRMMLVAVDDKIQQVRFGRFALQMPRGGNGRCQNGFPMAPCDYLPHASDNHSAAILLPLSPTVETAVDRTEPHVQVLSASVMRALPLHPTFPLNTTGKDTAVLLWAGALRDLPSALRTAESTFGAPSPRIGHLRAKDSPAMQQGYFLMPWESVPALVQAANASGLSYVMLEGWESSSGHYAVNEKRFPGGDDGLKSAVAELHAAGLRVGIHFLSCLISKDDAYLTPVPHPDLAVDAALSLAAGVSASSTFIPTTGEPTASPWLTTHWKAPASSGVSGGSTAYDFVTSLARIGDELVTYESVNASGLVGCTRGALGSKAAAHTKVEKAEHLAQMYDMVMPRPASALFEEISSRLAHVYNHAELDMVYFDGAEGLSPMGSEQVPISLFQQSFFSKLTRAILIEGSSIVPYTWWLNARANTGDYAFIDPKAYMDVQKMAQCAVHTRNQMNPELGWWGLDGGGVGFPATLPDELEYMARFAVALGVSPQIETGSLAANGRAAEGLSRMRPWALLQAHGPSTDLRETLMQTELDFEMRAAGGAGRYTIKAVKYHGNTGSTESRIADPARPETTRFTLQRHFGDAPGGPLGLRLRCLPALAAPGSKGNTLLLNPAADGSPAHLVGHNSSDALAVRAAFAPAPAMNGTAVKALALSVRVNGDHAYEATSEWALASLSFATPLDLATPSASADEERAIGAWIHSDGCGALLNLQLRAGAGYGGTSREWYVDLVWTGWRYVYLEKAETARTMFDYKWPCKVVMLSRFACCPSR